MSETIEQSPVAAPVTLTDDDSLYKILICPDFWWAHQGSNLGPDD